LGKWLDLHMLVLLGGRERTAAEYDTLFRAAGFKLGRVVPTPPGPSVVEAVPV
jgi:O-methyltransferase domain